jgi:hypothetical protein
VSCVVGSIEDPPVEGALDGIVLGLFTYGNVPQRERRVAMLRRWHSRLPPGAPLVFSVRRYEGAWHALRLNALLPLLGGDLREWGDWSGVDLGGDLRRVTFYYHFFTRRGLARELAAGGFACVEQHGAWAVGRRA